MNKNFEQLDKKYVLHSYKRNYINFVSGKNATLFDDRGSDYIDFTSGIGVASVGHGNKALADTICNQAKNIIHISNLYYIEPQALLAKKLVELSGYDMRAFFANSGAEANEGAIKIARKYGEVDGEIKRYKIITLKNSFHGRTITSLKATGQEKMHNFFGPFPDGFVYANDIDEVISLCDDKTVAVMIELIQGEGGVEPQDKQKVKILQEELKKRDILLIVDEVQTGIYRTGEFFASNLYKIKPDIITVAKGLGGGVPIGVVMTRLKDIFSYGDHGSTFGGNYLSTSASCTVLDILKSEKDSGKLDKRVQYFSKKLGEFALKHKNIINKEVGFALMRGLRISDEETLLKIIQEAKKNRVLLLRAGRNTLRFLPPLTITKAEIDKGFERLDNAFKNIF